MTGALIVEPPAAHARDAPRPHPAVCRVRRGLGIGNVLGAALGSAMMIVIATAAYIVGMLIIVIPSEIYLVLVRKKLLSEEKVSYR